MGSDTCVGPAEKHLPSENPRFFFQYKIKILPSLLRGCAEEDWAVGQLTLQTFSYKGVVSRHPMQTQEKN